MIENSSSKDRFGIRICSQNDSNKMYEQVGVRNLECELFQILPFTFGYEIARV